MGGGALYAPSLCGVFPFTQKIFRQLIPENSLISPTFLADAPMKKKQILFYPLWDAQY